ncbi:MAG: VOC family protein [Pseudomonadota bacterium]
MGQNIKANGVNHLALSTSNMKEQIAFFTDVLGMRLIALYWMHGVEGCWHGFLELNDTSAIAFVFNPANEKAKVEYGVTNPGHTGGASAPGTMQHLALNVDSKEDLLNLRDRIRSRGVNVVGPLDHGFCHSIYFQGPEDMCLEIATYGDVQYPMGAKDWIDPEVQALAGISNDELQQYINPAQYAGEGGAVPQPEFDPAGYHPAQPEALVRGIISMPDEAVTAHFSEPRPPSVMNQEDREAKHAS